MMSFPTSVDRIVGGRLRLRRKTLMLHVRDVAEAAGVPVGQLEKFEKGAARISASNLYSLARALNVPASFFFEDAHEQPKAANDRDLIAWLRLAPDPRRDLDGR